MIVRCTNTTMLLSNLLGGYRFLRGGKAFSAGVIAAEGFAIEYVRLSRLTPWRAGFELVDAHLRAAGRPRQSLCAVSLRSPAAFTFAGFKTFNDGYADLLKSWDILVDG